MSIMHKIVIKGGNPLHGSVAVSGSKNAVLPIMAGTLLADGEYRIKNVPILRDVKTMGKLLGSIGPDSKYTDHTLVIRSEGCQNPEAPYDLVKTMRASLYVLGPLVSRFGYAKVSLPGGCAWGPRPVNLHIEGLKKMGARIKIQKGYIIAKTERLQGAHIQFDIPSVGATAQLLLASVLARGVTTIENASKEPEVGSLARFLNKMGANISGIDTEHLEIEGVRSLHPANVTVIPDRIEAGTFLVAAHMTGGKVRLEGVVPRHVQAILDKLRECGSQIQTGKDWIMLESDGRIEPVDVTTAVYPGFPTDMQAQWMALMSVAQGASKITDTIYHDRFTHVAELQRMGADIMLENNTAFIRGIKHLSGAPVMSTDLRASASLILAGLVAKGQTNISRVYHIDRGYEQIEEKLKNLGADIYRDVEPLVI